MKTVLVSEGSGTLDTNEWTEKHARACDHFSINKYRDPTTSDFKTLARVLRKMETDAPGLVASRRLPALEEEDIRVIKKRLMLTNPEIDRNNLIDEKRDRIAGTCEWILRNPDFDAWLRGGNDISQLLLITGGPGKGKTFIALFLAEALKQTLKSINQRPVSVLYFFCVNKDARRNSASAILRGLLWQMTTAERSWVASHLKRQLADPDNAALVLDSRETLWQLFAETILDSRAGHMAFVIDGLDECVGGSADWLISKLADHFASLRAKRNESAGVRFVIVSRPSIRLPIERVRLDLDSELQAEVSADIRSCVTSSVARLSGLDGLDAGARKRLETTMLERAEGTFLWVGLAMDELSHKQTLTEVERVTSLLPTGLDATYKHMLLRVKPEHRAVSAQILRHLTVAQRPLTLKDLTALLPEPPEHQTDLKQYARDQVKHCGPIVNVNQDEVHFVHLSARDYMLQRETSDDPVLKMFRQGPEQAHFELARASLRSIRIYHDGGGRQHHLHCAFYDYALASWPDHALKLSATVGKKLVGEEKGFFENNRLLQTWWLAYVKTRTELGTTRRDKLAKDLPPIHGAAFIGFVPWLETLLEKTPPRKGFKKWTTKNPIDDDPFNVTALMCAALSGQAGTAEVLLRHGADPNGLGFFSTVREPLMLAAERGHEEVVRTLIRHHVRLVSRSSKFLSQRERAIHAAVTRGQEKTVRIMLDAGADVNDFDLGARTPLHSAAPGIVSMVVDSGAWINHKDDQGTTPLHAAVLRESLETARALLEAGANINARNHEGETPLHLAIDTSSDELIRLLLHSGANLETVDAAGSTPLIYATESRIGSRPREELIQVLLDGGADVRARNNAGQTAGAVAKEQGLAAIADILSRHEQRHRGETPGAEASTGRDRFESSPPARPERWYRFRARAEIPGSKTDARQIAFRPNEMCASPDPSGTWWLVRREADGRVGMGLPDYFEPVPDAGETTPPRLPFDYYAEIDKSFGPWTQGKVGGKLVAKLSSSLAGTNGLFARARPTALLTTQARAAAIRIRLSEVRQRSSLDGLWGTAQHDFSREEDYCLSMTAGERVLILEKMDELWMVGQNSAREIGVYPRDSVLYD